MSGDKYQVKLNCHCESSALQEIKYTSTDCSYFLMNRGALPGYIILKEQVTNLINILSTQDGANTHPVLNADMDVWQIGAELFNHTGIR